MNIPNDIQDKARELNLDMIATGGNLDYVFKKLDDGREAIIMAAITDGSPQSMEEHAFILIFKDDGWREYQEIDCPTAEIALNIMNEL